MDWELKLKLEPCIVCGRADIYPYARRGKKILSEFAELEGPICVECDTPALDWDLTITRGESTTIKRGLNE